MLSTIDRYIIREVAQSWLAVTGILLVILVSNRFALYLGEAAAGTLPQTAVFALLGLVSINYLVVLIPVALFLAVMLALGRFYRDSEMTTMMACGIGPKEIYKPLILLAGVLAIIVAILSLQVGPWAIRMSHLVRHDAEHAAQFGQLEAGRFKQLSAGKGVFYTEGISDNARLLHNVFAEQHKNGKVAVISAASGHRQADEDTGAGMLVLDDGYRYEGTPGKADFSIVKFHQHGIHITPTASTFSANTADVMTTAALWHSSRLDAAAELQWRISLPISVLLFVLLSVPLARSSPRQGRYGKLLMAVLVYVIYSNLLGVARVWLSKAVLPATIGIWWVPVAFLVVVISMLWWQNGVYWFRSVPRNSASGGVEA